MLARLARISHTEFLSRMKPGRARGSAPIFDFGRIMVIGLRNRRGREDPSGGLNGDCGAVRTHRPLPGMPTDTI